MLLSKETKKKLIECAMQQADAAILRGDEPYGAVIADCDGEIIAAAGNEENTACDPTCHAEMLAIRRAAQIRGMKSLAGCVIACNYKPCPMCAAAILMTGLCEIYIGSPFDGIEHLFLQTAEKVRTEQFPQQAGLAAETCIKQVQEGRKSLKEKNPQYQSGHKNGII